ncbi:ABC transporter ATP-binding protein [Celeribacter indicus]|uniref:Sugar ABC transporter n=1 Tax=Celeribacter indicus TaxID=1208324 RepID=A0A0B5E5S1_9RHOB|nr:sn-glycerol-3-phosphate ABC transporter ATP-binding protein UgpC [Celeribacter indicus]AJE48740.1 sugar ABC transporter [Celeribacter indicus]SDX11706.1 carbohydrate ABC transporter ATP-binding protein, CUT1 family [Celeribacter indicus]
MANLAFRNVAKTFGDQRVLSDINLEIMDGEFTVLVGPSGCGKSTLLRMIAGLETVSHGDIVINGRRVNGLQPKSRNIAMVFQNYALYPHMSVRRNMGFGLRMLGYSRADTDRRITDAARLLGLEALLDRKPGALSGGQRQRVAMGRAIVREPDVFLFDEPLSNLDAQLRTQLRTEIRALQTKLGVTSVYVTHDQVEAMTMADRIVVMRAGRIEQAGSPLELFDAPATRFVAGFIGSPSMNFLPATTSRSEGARVLRAENGAEFPLPAGYHALPEGQRVTYGIRPQHMALSERGPAGRVTGVETFGHEAYVQVDLKSIPLMIHAPGRTPIAPGETVCLEVDAEKAVLFDPDTGAALSRRAP